MIIPPKPSFFTSLFLESSVQGLMHPSNLLQSQKLAPLSIRTKPQIGQNEQLQLIGVPNICLSISSSICLPLLKRGLPLTLAFYTLSKKSLHLGRRHLAEHFYLLSCFKKRKSSPSLNLERSVLQQDAVNLTSVPQQGIHCVICCICCVCKVLEQKSQSRNQGQFLMCLDVGLPRYFFKQIYAPF